MDLTKREFSEFVDAWQNILPAEYDTSENPHDYHYVIRRTNTGDSLVALYLDPNRSDSYIELDYHTDEGSSIVGSKTFDSGEAVTEFLESTDDLRAEFEE